MFSIDLELPVSICSAWAEILPLQVVLPEVFFPPEGVLAQVFYDIHWYPMLWFFLPRSQQFHDVTGLKHHKKLSTCHSVSGQWHGDSRNAHRIRQAGFSHTSQNWPPQIPPSGCFFAWTLVQARIQPKAEMMAWMKIHMIHDKGTPNHPF